MIFVIDDDKVMAECVGKATRRDYRIFGNGIEAMNAISEGELPEMIFLDVLLDGPDGFTLMNELVTYEDTARIPVVVVSGLKMELPALSDYGVVGVLDKEKMRPEEIAALVNKFVVVDGENESAEKLLDGKQLGARGAKL